MLLSFAQFEREVTSERIRDKIAASKRKGLWVGGPLPLGYHMKDDKIAVNKVRTLFEPRFSADAIPAPAGQFRPEIQSPGTEFLDAETRGQESTRETVIVGRDRER